MGIIKVQDVEYLTFQAPDLTRMREFLLDFGMKDSSDTEPDVLRMRGTGDAPFLHKTKVGEAGFLGLALRAPVHRGLEISGLFGRVCGARLACTRTRRCGDPNRS